MNEVIDKNELKNIRESLGFTLEQFAQKLGVSFQTVWRWESGKCKPSPLAMDKIRKYVKNA
jgi:transcriptional regulator with XRE-family HTH domain